MRRAVSVGVSALVVLYAAGAGAEKAYVEGYVFNKLNGVPVTSASVSIVGGLLATGTIGTPIIELILGKPAVTDGNGFYSIEINLDEVDEASRTFEHIRASCLTPNGVASTNRWATRVGLRPGTIRRDLYLEGLPIRRAPVHCQIRFEPSGRSQSGMPDRRGR